ncbi:4418_t:CDS:2 [Gigaspora margarita]|uniref:4418_t:CDS:1 n=1 Tax=Gigaspora margarita TaxID=4874 RepID=A0ABM8W3I6_GIGMA|nr:4418_t:CDS:2 [Gigaspora margarita]
MFKRYAVCLFIYCPLFNELLYELLYGRKVFTNDQSENTSEEFGITDLDSPKFNSQHSNCDNRIKTIHDVDSTYQAKAPTTANNSSKISNVIYQEEFHDHQCQENNSYVVSKLAGKRRTYVTAACTNCMKKHSKCSGKPRCINCLRLGLACIFTDSGKKRGPKLQRKKIRNHDLDGGLNISSIYVPSQEISDHSSFLIQPNWHDTDQQLLSSFQFDLQPPLPFLSSITPSTNQHLLPSVYLDPSPFLSYTFSSSDDTNQPPSTDFQTVGGHNDK